MATMFFRQEPGYGCPRRTPDEKGGTRRRGPKHRIGREGRRDMTRVNHFVFRSNPGV